MIGAGCARKLVFSWGGNPGVGSLHRFRDAVENGWPRAARAGGAQPRRHGQRVTSAGASGLPFAVLRGYLGTDLPTHTPTIKSVTCPFTGEGLAAVPALDPDVAIIHAQRADRSGNVQLWGVIGVQKEAVLCGQALDRHGRGDRRRARAGAGRRSCCPHWAIDAVWRGARRRRPVLRARLLRARQRRLPGLGRDQPRPRALHRLDRGLHGTTGVAESAGVERSDWPPTDEMMTIAAAAGAWRRRQPCASSASACRARRPTSPDARTRPSSVLIYESGALGAKPTAAAALDRRRRARRDGGRRGERAGDLQLLAAAGAHRRRLPRRRADRPLRATSTRP